MSSRTLLSFAPPDQGSPLPLVADALDALAAAVRAFADREVRVPAGEEEFYSVVEVAVKLGISQSQVRHEIRTGKLRARRFGKRNYRIAAESLALYVKRSHR